MSGTVRSGADAKGVAQTGGSGAAGGEPSLRPAHPSDGPAVAAVYAASWPLSSAHVAPPAVVTALLAQRDVAFWTAQLSRPEARFWVAEVAGPVAGFAGWTTHPDGHAELVWLFVDPAAHRHGVGGRLHDRALADMAGTDAGTADLWAVPGNQQAEAFYRRRGWTPAADRKDVRTDAGSFPLRRWSRPLRPLTEPAAPPVR